MGNAKSSSSVVGISPMSQKRSVQPLSTSTNPPEVDQQQSKWTISERDVAFLRSQTGKYRYFFKVDPFCFSHQHRNTCVYQ